MRMCVFNVDELHARRSRQHVVQRTRTVPARGGRAWLASIQFKASQSKASQVNAPIERLAADAAHMRLLGRVDDLVPAERTRLPEALAAHLHAEHEHVFGPFLSLDVGARNVT